MKLHQGLPVSESWQLRASALEEAGLRISQMSVYAKKVSH